MFLHIPDSWVHYWITNYFPRTTIILKYINTKYSFSEKANTISSIVGIPIIGILITTGVGLFEANALQFGLDQLLEAPTPKLIAFIHWYYWTHNAVQLVAIYLMTSWLDNHRLK